MIFLRYLMKIRWSQLWRKSVQNLMKYLAWWEVQYCVKVMRANFDENVLKLCYISKKANFQRYFDALILPISFKFRANVRNFAWHLVRRTKKFRLKFRSGKQNFVWESKISRNSSFGERNFVHHFVWGREILCTISFVRVDIKLNADEIKSCAYNTF